MTAVSYQLLGVTEFTVTHSRATAKRANNNSLFDNSKHKNIAYINDAAFAQSHSFWRFEKEGILNLGSLIKESHSLALR